MVIRDYGQAGIAMNHFPRSPCNVTAILEDGNETLLAQLCREFRILRRKPQPLLGGDALFPVVGYDASCDSFCRSGSHYRGDGRRSIRISRSQRDRHGDPDR
jgi:hypothetical protein